MRIPAAVKRPAVAAAALAAAAAVGIVAYVAGASAATSVAASCSSPSYDGTNFSISCVVPQVTSTVTSTVTVTSPGPTVTVTATATTPSPSPTPSATTTTPPPPAAFPNATNTGVPAGTTLATYSGSLNLGCGTVLVGYKITGDIEITGGNGTTSASTPCVTIQDSLIVGTVHTAGDNASGSGPLVLTDDEFAPTVNSQRDAVVGGNYYLTRVNVHGGAYGGIQCDGNCVVTDSWTHDFIDKGATHYDGIGSNGLNGATVGMDLEHDSIGCNFVSQVSGATGGCSGDLGLFGDFSAIAHVTVNNSLFLAASGTGINADPYRPSFCAYSNIGNTGKAYPSASYMTFSNDTFQRGPNGKCGQYGPMADWTSSKDAANHNSWTNNKWDDGTTLPEPS